MTSGSTRSPSKTSPRPAGAGPSPSTPTRGARPRCRSTSPRPGSGNNAPTNITLSNAAIAEHAASGATIGTFASTDADAGDSHTYSLVSGLGSDNNASFYITNNALFASTSFNFETKASYAIRVASDDGNGGSFQKAFTIAVSDVNEAPTDISLSNATVAENLAAGTTVGQLSSTDPDIDASASFSLVTGTGSDDNALFSITGASLKTNTVFDFETRATYSIRVRTSDGRGGSFDKLFSITVANVNEPPTDLNLSAANVATNQAVGAPRSAF